MCGGHKARTEENRNAHRVLARKLNGRGEWEDVRTGQGIILYCCTETLGSTESGTFLDWLRS